MPVWDLFRILAIDRFRKPFHLSRAAVLGTYYAGQLLIAISVPLSILFMR